MKVGRMMTAAALMAAMATADTKATIQRFAMMLQAGTFRSRGKGRGSISPTYGKTGGEPQGLRLQRGRGNQAARPDAEGNAPHGERRHRGDAPVTPRLARLVFLLTLAVVVIAGVLKAMP